MRTLWIAAAALIAVACCSLVVAVGFAVVRQSQLRNEPAAIDRQVLRQAEESMRRCIEGNLLAPSTAKIEVTSEFSEGKTIVRLRAQVDSQNAFGAMLRKNYVGAYNVDAGRLIFAKEE